MDFDKTSFSVDWFTPEDRYAPKRLSFPKSAYISIDDLVLASPLSFCFSPVDETIPHLCSYSLVDTPVESSCDQTISPLVPLDPERSMTYDQDSKLYQEDSVDWRSLASPALLSVVDDFALCGVDVDVSCLDALDEQLLSCPMASFAELCWAAAVDDDCTPPVISRRNTRSRVRSFKGDHKQAFPSPSARDYPGSLEHSRPLAAKTTLPLETFPHYLSSPSRSHGASPMLPEKRFAHVSSADPEGRPSASPVQDVHTPQRLKRDLALTPSTESLPQPRPSKARVQPSRSSNALRAACSAFGRARKISLH